MHPDRQQERERVLLLAIEIFFPMSTLFPSRHLHIGRSHHDAKQAPPFFSLALKSIQIAVRAEQSPLVGVSRAAVSPRRAPLRSQTQRKGAIAAAKKRHHQEIRSFGLPLCAALVRQHRKEYE